MRPPIFNVGDVLSDSYEIRAVLGAGGMGQVFDAHDRGLGRRVAIKANYPDVADQYPVRVEAQALAAIRHPGVVGVYALGHHENVDFMVMEHVSGVTLAHQLERVEKAGFPLSERLEILVAVADGLAAVHRAGISHGDIKPENVLLAPSGRTVLTDLGLVRAAYQPDTEQFAGTLEFMAPEIISSARFPAAGRHLTDIYAFGVLAFRVLSGAHPFGNLTGMKMLMQHLDAPIPKLSELGFPRRVSELVEKMMAKDPMDRPAMDAVLWQLRIAKEDSLRKATGNTQAGVAPPLTVLVVDDDQDIAKLVAMYVKQSAPKAEITFAHDAQEALAQFRKKPPRLVFLDLHMPKMSGFELFTYLRGVNLVDASAVVAMSAGGSTTDVELMLELGAHDFIPKGPELRARIAKIVDGLTRQDARQDVKA